MNDLKPLTLVPNMRKANCAKAMKTMPNMMKNAPTSGALRCSVPASCDMVLLKEMYLKILITPRNTFTGYISQVWWGLERNGINLVPTNLTTTYVKKIVV